MTFISRVLPSKSIYCVGPTPIFRMGSTLEEFRMLIDEDMKKMRSIARQANITPR